MATLKPIIRRPKAAEDVEGHAMYIADGSIDAALRFLERAEQTIKGLALYPASGAPFAFDDRNSSPRPDHLPTKSTAEPPDSSRARWQSHPPQTPQHEPTVP